MFDVSSLMWCSQIFWCWWGVWCWLNCSGLKTLYLSLEAAVAQFLEHLQVGLVLRCINPPQGGSLNGLPVNLGWPNLKWVSEYVLRSKGDQYQTTTSPILCWLVYYSTRAGTMYPRWSQLWERTLALLLLLLVVCCVNMWWHVPFKVSLKLWTSQEYAQPNIV